MNILEPENHASTGLPGLDALIGDGIREQDSILIASADPQQSIGLVTQIAQHVAATAPTLAFGLPVEPAPHLHVCKDEIGYGKQMTESLAYAAGQHPPRLAAFGLLEQFAQVGDDLENTIEDVGLAIIYAGHRRGFATLMAARLEPGYARHNSGYYGPTPIGALGVYDPMGGHVHLALFIEPAWRGANEEDVSIRVLKWRFGPTGGTVRATWDWRTGAFDCPRRLEEAA